LSPPRATRRQPRWSSTPTGPIWTNSSPAACPILNDLTDRQRIDPLSGNAALNGLPVTVLAA
jgi:hypothetical protein